MKSLTLLFTCLLTMLSIITPQLAQGEESIVVNLATADQLVPLHLTDIENDNSDFSSYYLQQLQDVLHFDFDNNGTTRIIESLKLKDLATKSTFDNREDPGPWRNQGIHYVLRTKVHKNKLYASILATYTKKTHKINDIPLTGNLNRDRRQIHELTNTFHHKLFGTKSIAITKILYTLKTRTSRTDSYLWISEVWEADYDGANARQITHENSFCVTPAYLPPLAGRSSGTFFYVSYRLGQPKIYIASLNDGIGRRLTFLRGNQLMPAISPQRDLVVFINDVTSNADLFLQPFNTEVGAMGKPQQIFAAHQATQASPTFSPDGEKIAFVSNKDGLPRIYIMNTPARRTLQKKPQAQLLTRNSRESTAPSWSPDGQKIAYCSKTEGTRQIWFINIKTGEATQLTTGPEHKENPTWAFDSKHLIFNSANEESSELYLIGINRRQTVKISSGPGEKRFPQWEQR